MRLPFIALTAFVALVSSVLISAAGVSQPLARFSADNMHIQLGSSSLVKVYVHNPDAYYANITLWITGDYPTDMVRFTGDVYEPGVYYTADMKNATVQLNPGNDKVMTLVALSTLPKTTGYNVTLNANTTASIRTVSKNMTVFLDYPASFPGLEAWGIILLLALSGLAYWRLNACKNV